MGSNECDDDNSAAGDGCDLNCEIEVGYTCGTGSFAKFDLCFEVCGDGRAMQEWLCDDGNAYNGDGCDADCALEKGYECDGGDTYYPDVCIETCGDGFNMGINPCDDRNTVDGDGCSSLCQVESGWTCAGGTANNLDTCVEDCGDGRNYGEFFCDDGNNDNGDGCSSTCDIEINWTCGGGSPDGPDFCWRPHPYITDMSIVPNNTVLTLSFNETVYMQSAFTKDDLIIFVGGPRDYYSFSFEVIDLQIYKGTGVAFTTLSIQLYYDDIVQFFGYESEGMVLAVRNGDNILNLRDAPLMSRVFVTYAEPLEGTYKCEMDTLWKVSFYMVIGIAGLNALGYFMEITMNYFFQLAYFLQIISLLPLIKVFPPSCLSMYFRDVAIANGDNYYIYTNFLGMTFDKNELIPMASFWYGFTRSGYETNSFLGDTAGIMMIWLYGVLLIFFFNFLKGMFPNE